MSDQSPTVARLAIIYIVVLLIKYFLIIKAPNLTGQGAFLYLICKDEQTEPAQYKQQTTQRQHPLFKDSQAKDQAKF